MTVKAASSGRVEEVHLKSNRKKVLAKLDELIQQADARVRKLEELGIHDEAYNYLVVKNILTDVRQYVERDVKVKSKNTYMMPGALWIAKSLITGNIDLDIAAYDIKAVRYLATRMFRMLVYEKDLTFLIPSNLRTSDIKVYLWVDKVGYDRNGNPLFMLTMYFSFPFDIHEFDKRSEYEPISILFAKKGGRYVPVKAYARVHYDIYVYDLEKLDKLTILFMRSGHTPKILGSSATRVSSSNVVKEALDRLWLAVGDAVTRIAGVSEVKIRDDPKKIRVYVTHKLPRSVSNVFETAVHPYFVDVTI